MHLDVYTFKKNSSIILNVTYALGPVAKFDKLRKWMGKTS